MPKPLTSAQRATVTSMLSQRTPHKQVAIAAGCSLSQVKRMSQNMRKFGLPNKPKLKVQGRPRTLAPEVLEVFASLVSGLRKGTCRVSPRSSFCTVGGISDICQFDIQHYHYQVNCFKSLEENKVRSKLCMSDSCIN
jgi:transposase